MAENQSSLNENLIAAGLNPSSPTSTYVDFADALARNQREQADQEQALALAKEHVAQAKIQTRNETGAEAAGVNPLLMDVMTPEQAVAWVKAALHAKGITDVDDDVDAWAKQLTGPVNRNEVEAFASRFARDTARLGTPFVADEKDATGGKRDENGDPLVDGQTYAALYDNRGTVQSYVRSGQERPDTSAKDKSHESDVNRKEWRALNDHIDGAFKTRSGGLGSLITAIYRSVRAINTLHSHSVLTAQDLGNVSQDVAGIYQGGAPTVASAEENDYGTAMANLANVVRHYTGAIIDVHAPLQATREKLLQVLSDLRDSTIENFKTWMDSQASGYATVIESNPPQWDEMKASKVRAVESGLLLTPDEKDSMNMTGAELSTPAKNPLKKLYHALTSKDSAPQGASVDEKKAALRAKLGLTKK